MQGLNNDSMARFNRFTLLRLLYHYDILSISELASYANLTVAAVSRILKKLQEEKIVVNTQQKIPVHGRHQGYWKINRKFSSYICIEIAPKAIISQVVDFLGTPLSPMRVLKQEFTKSSQLLRALESECNYWHALFPKIKHVGVAVTGLVNYATEHSVFRAHMTSKNDVDIKSFIEQSTGLHVHLDNNCNTMLLAEKWLGKKDSLDSCILLHIDYGIGAAFLKKGKIFRGSQHTALQIGHFSVDPKGEICPCGARGCLELVASEDRMLKLSGCSTVDEFYALLHQGDQKVKETYQKAVDYVALAVGALINLFEPSKIVITGSFLQGGEFDHIRTKSSQYCIPLLYENCEIVSSTLLPTQQLSGAAFLWIEQELNI